MPASPARPTPAPEPGGRCALSVVIASYRGAATIGTTLDSLAAQTLPRDRFEVIVVQNGEPDRTAEVLTAARRAYPGLTLRRLEHRVAGLGRARNTGMAMARGEFVTFVDDDDTISPTYLAALLECSAPDTVGVATVADLATPRAAPDFETRVAGLLQYAGRTLHPGSVPLALSFSVGKSLPTVLARAVGFDRDLRSAEDIAFYVAFFMRYPLAIRFCPLEANAVYYRMLVPGSLSRQALSYEFNVTQRLDVIERLETLQPTQPWHRRALYHMTRGQMIPIQEFLRAHPDRRAEVLADVQARALTLIPPGSLGAGADDIQRSHRRQLSAADAVTTSGTREPNPPSSSRGGPSS